MPPAGFSQQGSVDWTSLGRMQFSASIAILSRLASAGVESITVAFGQAVCSRIHIGVQGETILRQRLENLKAFSSFGDVVWFGVGVRHVLRDIVQTSEGASLVALCASLSETFSIRNSALILHEIAGSLKAPGDLSPSMTQWEALVGTSSCVLRETTFGIKVQKLLDLAGYTSVSVEQWHNPGHPRDLAEAVLGLGRVTRGELDSITVSGGPVCAWLATYAYYILGLRVEVNSSSTVLLRTYDNRMADAQLRVDLLNDEYTSMALDQVSTTFIVRDGNDFIDRICNGGHTIGQETHFLGGSLTWDRIFVDAFGNDSAELLGRFVAGSISDGTDTSDFGAYSSFRTLYMLGLNVFLNHAGEHGRYHDIEGYVLAMVDNLPELRPLDHELWKSSFKASYGEELKERYNAASRKLRAFCGCNKCSHELGNPNYSRRFCLQSVAETILLISYLLGRCELRSQLRPKRLGVLLLYQELNDENWKQHEGVPHHHSIEKLTSHLTLGSIGTNTSALFGAYTTLFQGSRCNFLVNSRYPSAYSDGSIYCFLGSLTELSMDYAHCSKVYIGSGVIQYQSVIRRWVFDKANINTLEPQYLAHRLTVTKGLTALMDDTSSKFLRVEAVVHDGVQLEFHYRVVSPDGRHSISPSSFVSRCLLPITLLRIKTFERLPFSNGVPYPKEATHDLVIGEGYAVAPKSDLVLRPHKGNVLGQCVALSWFPGQSIFVTSEDQLTAFLQWYILEGLEKNTSGSSRPSYFVISG